jgi:phosphoglycolate phosphatase
MTAKPTLATQRPDALIFDLDGTLWDTTEACVVAWNRVARELGMAVPVLTAEDIRRVTGLPHTEAVQRVFEAASEAEVEALSKRTQAEDNRVIGEAGGVLYGGVSELVPELAGRLPLHIVSSVNPAISRSS